MEKLPVRTWGGKSLAERPRRGGRSLASNPDVKSELQLRKSIDHRSNCNYKKPCDELKRQANLVKHGIDFADVGEEFYLSSLVIPAKDGRFAAIGEMNGTTTVIFAVLGTEGVSIISARPASITERRFLP